MDVGARLVPVTLGAGQVTWVRRVLLVVIMFDGHKMDGATRSVNTTKFTIHLLIEQIQIHKSTCLFQKNFALDNNKLCLNIPGNGVVQVG
jgi:hypothetical protein